MTTPNDYAFLVPIAMKYFRDQQAAEESTRKPRLTLVTTAERTQNMEPQHETPPASPGMMPLHKHGAFNDITAHLEFIQLGIAALRGIGAMLSPASHDQQLDNAHSSDASAVFAFFGEALEDSANKAYNAKERLERAAAGGLS